MGKGGSSKGSAAGGQWVFVPTGKPLNHVIKQSSSGGKGKKGGGKGKGKRPISMVRRAAKTQPEKCAWIGGLPERDMHKDAELNKKLQEWINKLVPGCKFVDIGSRGSGGAIFSDEAAAAQAVAKLNGKKFQGSKLQFDSYVKGWTGGDDE